MTFAAECTLDEVEGAPKITSLSLSISGRLRGIDHAGFGEAVERAGALCPVWNTLRGNVVIEVRSER